jgi:hypothetical protein
MTRPISVTGARRVDAEKGEISMLIRWAVLILALSPLAAFGKDRCLRHNGGAGEAVCSGIGGSSSLQEQLIGPSIRPQSSL